MQNGDIFILSVRCLCYFYNIKSCYDIQSLYKYHLVRSRKILKDRVLTKYVAYTGSIPDNRYVPLSTARNVPGQE